MTATDLDPTFVAIGRAVRAAREAAGLSTRALASRCGISQAFVSQTERGITAPSLSSLYRIADALGVSPASLLPSTPSDDVHFVGAADGDMVPSSDRPASAVGRVVLADQSRDLEIYEYRAAPSDDLDVWFQHPGDKVLFLIDGALRVDFVGRPSRSLRAGDCLVHAGEVPHRWQVEGDEDVRLLLVVTRHHPPTAREEAS
ncbi:MAG: helix-turn-helix domain-containing protein [Ilumatobacteraceae bacterium]|jgi:transcriptional regulator with XRE-family HTH domain